MLLVAQISDNINFILKKPFKEGIDYADIVALI
jgi:hypothetical protein